MISRDVSVGKVLATAFMLPIASAAGVYAAKRLQYALHEKFCPKFDDWDDDDDDDDVGVVLPLKPETSEEFRGLVTDTLKEFARPELDIIHEVAAAEVARRDRVLEAAGLKEKEETKES